MPESRQQQLLHQLAVGDLLPLDVSLRLPQQRAEPWRPLPPVTKHPHRLAPHLSGHLPGHRCSRRRLPGTPLPLSETWLSLQLAPRQTHLRHVPQSGLNPAASLPQPLPSQGAGASRRPVPTGRPRRRHQRVWCCSAGSGPHQNRQDVKPPLRPVPREPRRRQLRALC